MKTLFSTILLLGFGLNVASAADRWPACAPVLGFTASDIGVASYELDPSTRTGGSWLCLLVNRETHKVKTVPRETFDELFQGVIVAGNRRKEDCQEMLAAPAPNANPAESLNTCVSPKVFCGGMEITVRVSSTVAKLPCPARLFSAATLLDDRLWAAVAPLDPYRREYPGAGLIVQVLDGSVASRLTPKDLGGKQVCAIRRDPFTNSVWATTENGLVEFTLSGKVKRVLQMRELKRPEGKSTGAKAP